jgi:hypothetical protein
MIGQVEGLAGKVGVTAACLALGVPRGSLYRSRAEKQKPRASAQSPALPPRSLSPQEKVRVRQMLNSERFQAQGWPIGSGIVESGNKLVVEARLKGAGMHCRLAPSCSRHERWAEEHFNPMLAIRYILCSNRWKEEWPKIEARLRKQKRQHQR